MGFLIVDIVHKAEPRKNFVCSLSFVLPLIIQSSHTITQQLSQNQPDMIHISSHAPKFFFEKETLKNKN